MPIGALVAAAEIRVSHVYLSSASQLHFRKLNMRPADRTLSSTEQPRAQRAAQLTAAHLYERSPERWVRRLRQKAVIVLCDLERVQDTQRENASWNDENACLARRREVSKEH